MVGCASDGAPPPRPRAAAHPPATGDLVEQYARLLSDLSMDWSAYGSMLQSQPPRAADPSGLPASQDLAAVADVDFSDSLLMQIQKATNELDVQMFVPNIPLYINFAKECGISGQPIPSAAFWIIFAV